MSFGNFFFVFIPNMVWYLTYSGVLTPFLTIFHFWTFFNRDLSVKQKSETLWKWGIFRKNKKFHNFLPFRPDVSPFEVKQYLKKYHVLFGIRISQSWHHCWATAMLSCTGLHHKAVPRFGECCPCCCLSHLPQRASSILATWEWPYSEAL